MTERPPSVLVVENDGTSRAYVRSCLERAGYNSRGASDGVAALELYRQHPTDVVVTDLVISNAGGLDLIEYLSQERPAAKIVAMSTSLEKLRDALQLGADRVVPKPFSPPILIEAVSELVGLGSGEAVRG